MEHIKDFLSGQFTEQHIKEMSDRHKYISQEFQDYGYRLAVKLDDVKYKSLYIKLAKTKPRVLLERAFSFATDYPKATNKGKIFMWKLKELEEEAKQKEILKKEAQSDQAQLDMFVQDNPKVKT